MVLLKTDRLVIRDHKYKDIDSMHSLLSNRQAMYYLDDIRTNTLEETMENLTVAVNEAEKMNREKYFFAIEDKKDGRYIGEIGFTVTLSTPLGKIVNLGYFILPEFWGKGMMTEAVREVIRFAFEEIDVLKIETGCIKENIGSEMVMKKVGMIKEADYRMKAWHDGTFKHRVEYRLLRDEWKFVEENYSLEN